MLLLNETRTESEVIDRVNAITWEDTNDLMRSLLSADHALALALTCKKRYPLEENEARAYQEGQVIPCSDGLRGWMTPVYQGLQLGWGKASGGQIKNHYPKGLRK